MPRDPVALVPIRSFAGMSRLARTLGRSPRERLSRAVASLVLDAIDGAGIRAVVITADPVVATWAGDRAAEVCDDPGGGLSLAAAHGIASLGEDPWLVIHADLPLLTARAVARAAQACRSGVVIAPSYDGGTAAVGTSGPFPFAYGVGSFQRHLASVPGATVLVSPAFGVDIDTPLHLGPFAHLAAG